MPTPNVYRQSDLNPFDGVPAVFRTNEVDLLYVTDRMRETRLVAAGLSDEPLERLVYGSGVVGIGDGGLGVARESLSVGVRTATPCGSGGSRSWELPNPRLVPS
jgi:hypothetical protein